MNNINDCQNRREAIAALVLGELETPDADEIKKHIDACRNCRSFYQAMMEEEETIRSAFKAIDDRSKAIGDNLVLEHDKVSNAHDDISAEQVESQARQSAITKPNVWRTIMKSRITKLAAAAVIIVAVLTGLSIIDYGDSGVVWADVFENVEKARVLSYRLKTIIVNLDEGETIETESIVCNSAEFGIRVDTYVDGKVVSTSYMKPEEGMLITLIPEAKQYVRIPLSIQKRREYHQRNDPREIVREFMSYGYTELGHRNIKGIEAEGIEVNSPAFAKGAFDDLVARLWVGIETRIPVLLEMEGVTEKNAQIKIVMEQFDWDIEFEPTHFEASIPADFSALTREEESIGKSSEEKAIEALAAFAEISYGKYPSSLAIVTAMTEAGKALKESGRDPNDEEDVKRMMSHMLSVPAACTFYAELVQKNKDVAYYGDKVTAKNADAILMRWKISDNEYRVVFGDLSVGNATAEELANLEQP